MPSLLLIVFTLQLLLHVINTVGATAADELLWILYNKLPTSTSTNFRRTRVLKREILRLKRELGNTSAQDNFARWAKLDREHNKAMTEYQKLDGSLRTHRTTFTSVVSTLRWFGTQGLRFILQFWFAKSPMFWIPAGWVPYYVEWILSFPRAPVGSVSINVWGIACASMIALVFEALTAIYVLITHKNPLNVTEEPLSFEADQKPKPKAKSTTTRSEGEKKEL